MFSDIITNLLNEVFQDSDIQNLPHVIFNEPILYYKKALEAVAIDDPFSDEAIKRLSYINCSCPDFRNSAEEVLEGTIYNLAQEIIYGEFNPIVYPMLISRKEFEAQGKGNNK